MARKNFFTTAASAAMTPVTGLAGAPDSFLTGEEISPASRLSLLKLALTLKHQRGRVQRQDLKGKTVGLVFEKPSLRTRMSFAIGVQELGGFPLEISSTVRKHEEPEDTIRVLNGYCHAVMVRTFAHSNLERMQAWSRVPLINGLSDSHHPCQALADAMTIFEYFGWPKPLGGNHRPSLKLAYLGDGNNVLHSLLLLLPALGIEVHYACPPGHAPDSDIVERARRLGPIHAHINPREAVKGAHAVYTDVWTSMGFEEKSVDEQKVFTPYQINREIYRLARPDAIVMHCLPMNRGQEITDEMADHPRAALFVQSENRLHVQKALLIRLMGKSRNDVEPIYGRER